MSWTEIQSSPEFGFTIIGLIIVFGPLVAERLRLPGLLGLLLFGAVIGPNMLDVLPRFTGLQALGDVGVLYLIFLAGVQLDIESFKRYWTISAGFGVLTAFIPMSLGVAVALLLDIDMRPAILIGSFWASFTLIAYPTVSKFGLTRNRTVAAIVGASSITDAISLIVLALIVGAETGDATGARLVFDIALGFAVLAVYCFVIVPRIARWFFTGVGQERTLRFMLVFIALTSAAVVADLMDVEPLIGAFFVGVGLNRLVPNASPLAAVTDFIGNALFIPAFLVSVGLLFDPEVMFVWSTIRLALGFAGALIVGKAVAAWLTGRIFGLSGPETNLMFSMSVAQAAATLAATIIGLDIGLYGTDVVNAVMVVVALSLVVTSVGTNRTAPLIPPPAEEGRRPGEAILVPVFGPADGLRQVLQLGLELAAPVGGIVSPVVPVVSTDRDELAAGRRLQADVTTVLHELGGDVDTGLRVDRSVSTGLNRVVVESDASMLLLAWPGFEGVRARMFGADYSEIIAATSVPVAIAGLHGAIRKRIVLVAFPSNLLPGRLPNLRVGLMLAASLSAHGREELVVGPISASELTEAGLIIPNRFEHRPGPGDLVDWAMANTEPGDLLVVPFDDVVIGRSAVALHRSGRDVLAVAHNLASDAGAAVNRMSLPVQGTISS